MDFVNNGLGSLFSYTKNYRGALIEAGFDIEACTQKPHGYWKVKSNRIKEIFKLSKKLNKSPSILTPKQCLNNGLKGLLKETKGLRNALIEVGVNHQAGIRKPKRYWLTKTNRIKETRALLRRLRKHPSKINTKDFIDARLKSLIQHTKGHRKALIEAGFDNVPKPFKPRNYWKKRENRVKAIKELIQKLGKPSSKITSTDFMKNNLGGLLSEIGSPFRKALIEAGFNNPKEIRRPVGYWMHEKNRIKATKQLVKNLRKDPMQITKQDFVDAGLICMTYITRGCRNALLEAGLLVTPRRPRKKGYWNIKNNRIKAVKDFVKKLGKPVNEITAQDFRNHGCNIILKIFNGSPSAALLEAGYTIDEMAMRKKRSFNTAKIYTSNHGHKFSSIFERDLDNYLWNMGLVDHTHEVPYPESNMNCDFVIGNYWIEAAGLTGREWYDEKIKKKKEIAKKHRIKLIIITMEDFYRKKVLERKLADVLREHGTEYNEKLTRFA